MRHALALAFLLLCAPAAVRAGDPPLPSGRRLRVIVAEKFPEGNVRIGGTTGWRKRPRGPGVILDREFGYVTPENDFKQSRVHPRPGAWHWTEADAWLASAREHGQVLRVHGPVGPQCSAWAKEDGRTAEELRRMLVEHVRALCERCAPHEHVRWMDVVNETVLSDGSWHGPRPGTGRWECPWTRIGFDESHPLRPPLYIRLAFETAARHAPRIRFVLNQHGGMEERMWDRVKALVRYLRGEGLRVDGLGWQAHVDAGWETRPGNLERLRSLIGWAHANELAFHVTEQNAWMRGATKDLEAQARTFAAIVRALLAKRGTGTVTWNVWNLSDRDAWRQEKKWEGCLFDRSYRAKPAYYAVQRLLENPPPLQAEEER